MRRRNREEVESEKLHRDTLITLIEPIASATVRNSPADSPLGDAPNLVITPHTAGASTEKERRRVEILCDNLTRFANHEPLVNLVNKRLGY